VWREAGLFLFVTIGLYLVLRLWGYLVGNGD
jgi:hypothetical protein